MGGVYLRKRNRMTYNRGIAVRKETKKHKQRAGSVGGEVVAEADPVRIRERPRVPA